MATLHMEVEVCRSGVTSFTNAAQSLEQIFSNLNNTINGMQSGAWVGNSANEFFSLYSASAGKFKTLQADLQDMATKLTAEVNEWETMAAKLG
jgi:WXG100 family type VII secretion target